MARTAGSQSDITAARLQEAALHLFARHGYAAVSMRQIATEVGVQAGALYNYISDKQTLLFDLMRGHMEDVLTAWAEEKPSDDPVIALEQFVRFHIRFHAARPDAVFIAYMELRNLSEENFTALETLRNTYEDELEQILRNGAEAGVFQISEARVTTMALIAMLTGVNTWFDERGRLALRDVEDIYLNMARSVVKIGE